MFKVIPKAAAKTTVPENVAGVPSGLKKQAEALSGLSMDAVRIHYSSNKPAQVQALAYAQENQIHLGPGEEHLLPHELAHVIQQRQGRVPPTGTVGGLPLNDNVQLEREADSFAVTRTESPPPVSMAGVIQRAVTVKNINPSNASISVVIKNYSDLYDGKLAKINFIADTFEEEYLDMVKKDLEAADAAALSKAELVSAFKMMANEALAASDITVAAPSMLTHELCRLFRPYYLPMITKLQQLARSKAASLFLNCPKATISAKGSSYSYKDTGYFYKTLVAQRVLIHDLPVPGAADKIDLGHEAGPGDKQFVFQINDQVSPQKFAVAAHAGKHGDIEIYKISETFGDLVPQIRKDRYIGLYNGRMQVGALNDVKAWNGFEL